MREAYRPLGRIFCLVLMLAAAAQLRAFEIGLPASRWMGAYGDARAADAVHASLTPQGGPSLTTVADTVYLADGTPAQGNVVILWPAFVTASGAAVAAGTMNVTLGANGALSVGLAPNAGATPAGVYYTAVFQLGPGEVRTEYWLVPTTSPANLATVRTTPGGGVAAQPVSVQYVNSALATKANDNAVVHLSGAETISGAKVFSTAPSVPPPVNSGDVATKGYVDTSVQNFGSGNYLPTAGGTMTGPLTLGGTPTAPMQATPKGYVDSATAMKADLIAGLVPRAELGSGTASSSNCLLGNGTWGPCASSANATAIQSVPVASSGPSDGQVLAYSAAAGQYAPSTIAGAAGGVSLTPPASQNIVQPAASGVSTQLSTNNLANIRYVTASWNWTQSPTDDLSSAGSKTIHLSPCPLGMDASSGAHYYSYKVYVAGTGTPEAVAVTGGNCTPGTSSGTITVTTAYAHAAGYTVGSSTGGIQEAWNDAWVNDFGTSAAQTSPYVKLVSNQQYNIYSTVYLRGRGGLLDGAGALIACSTRDRCFYVGTTQGQPFVNHHKVYNISAASTVNVDGVPVASVSAASGTYTVTTASAHPFVAGDMVDCEYHSQTADQHWVSTVQSVLTSTSFTAKFGGTTFAAGGYTFGFCNLLNAFLENNSDHVLVQDINLFQSSPAAMGYFSYGIVNDNDQQFVIERASNRSSAILHHTANWPIGAFVYERNDQANSGITYIHNSEFTGVNCATGGGNGFVVTDTVCQGFPVYGFRYFGGLQPSTFENVYQESTGSQANPLYGIPAQMGYVVQGGQGTKVLGTWPINGYSPVFASGGGTAAERTYFVVPRSSTLGYGPVLFIGSAEATSGSVSIPLTWPSIELQSPTGGSVGTLTWDVLVTTGLGTLPPYGTGNYAIATGISGNCNSSGLCSFTDTQAAGGSYTVSGQQYTPVFWYWPVNIAINSTTVLLDSTPDSPGVVASQGTMGVSIVASQCRSGGTSQQKSPIWETCLASDSNGGSGTIATVLQEQDNANNGPAVNSKGRVNLAKAVNNFPNDLVTLQDSNFAKTLASAGGRPSNDAGDMALGVDQAGGLSERAATSISSYINALPSGTNFQERLTAAGKTFNVPVTINGNLTVTGTCTGCGGGGSGSGTVGNGSATQVALYAANGTAVSGDGGLTDNGTTLNYAGSGGVSAASGTFAGNVTVNGQLLVAGPWTVSSPIPGSAMGPAAAGTSALGISNDGNFYVSANGGAPQKVATSATSSYFSNLWQEDANDLGMYNGTNAQGLDIYGTRPDASDYERLTLTYDTVNTGYFKLDAQALGTGTHRGLAFWVNGAARWGVDQLDMFKPFVDNAYDVGSPTFRARNGYFGTGVTAPSLTLNGSALSSVIGTPSSALMTAGAVSGSGQPLCTDGTGYLTITTVGCPPGTGTIGGSGTTPQFAYWTNTAGLGAAPLYVTNANTVEQYNGTNVQTFNVYGTFTNATNYERLSAAYVPGDTYYELQTQQAGTGSQRGICFGVNNSCKWAVDTATAFKPFNDNARDIGTSSLRVRDFYLGRNLVMSGTATTYNGKATAGTGLAPVYGAVSVTGQTAAIGSTTLCATATCRAGEYVVNYYLDSTVSCTTAGSGAASLTIGWTDETNAKTLQAPLSGAGVSGGNSMALGSTANFGSGSMTLWSAGGANLTYSTSYTGCTTGTGTYALRITVRQLQ